MSSMNRSSGGAGTRATYSMGSVWPATGSQSVPGPGRVVAGQPEVGGQAVPVAGPPRGQAGTPYSPVIYILAAYMASGT
jgi:hypothetical protein